MPQETTGADAVIHQPEQSRFAIPGDAGGEDAELSYVQEGNQLDLQHTYVPQAHAGKGWGKKLVEKALSHARAQGLRVIPTCSYVAAYLKKHNSDWADVL